MGATVWQRDDAGGKTFSMGGRTPGRPVAAPGKRKLVWTRDSQQPGSAEVAGTPNPSSAPAPVDDANPSKRRRSTTDSTPTAAKRAVPSHHRSNGRAAAQPSPSTAAASAGTARHPAAAAGETNDARPGTSATPPGLGLARQLQRKQSEMERLKQAMYAQQRKLHAEQEAAKRAETLEQQRLAGEKEEAVRRRRRLEAGFAQAFRQEQEEQAAASKGRKATSAADAREVARVRASRTDYECLRLPAGASAAVIRKKYKEMAVALHPDKCKVEGASDAFRRLVQAQQNLLKYAA